MYEAPLRCARCGVVIVKKDRAKTPKYCVGCRRDIQSAYKEKLKLNRQKRFRGE